MRCLLLLVSCSATTMMLDQQLTHSGSRLTDVNQNFKLAQRNSFFLDLTTVLHRPSIDHLRVQKSLAKFKNRTQKLSLDVVKDRVYFGNLYFGSSSQRLSMMIDTGSEILAL